MLTNDQRDGIYKAVFVEDGNPIDTVCRIYRRLLLNHIIMQFGDCAEISSLYQRCEDGTTSDIDAIDEALKIHGRLAIEVVPRRF